VGRTGKARRHRTGIWLLGTEEKLELTSLERHALELQRRDVCRTKLSRPFRTTEFNAHLCRLILTDGVAPRDSDLRD
jgi:hypothetical protein